MFSKFHIFTLNAVNPTKEEAFMTTYNCISDLNVDYLLLQGIFNGLAKFEKIVQLHGIKQTEYIPYGRL